MDPREKWICPLCRTGHPNERSSVRAYLSVCEIFLQANVEARIQLINKHKYCKLCTMNLANKTHQTSSICPKTDRFKCSNCTEPKSLTHCSLLCLANQRNHSTRGRPAQRNPGHGRGGSRGRQPGSGHPPPGRSHSSGSESRHPSSGGCRQGFQGYTKWNSDPINYKDWEKAITN